MSILTKGKSEGTYNVIKIWKETNEHLVLVFLNPEAVNSLRKYVCVFSL